MIYIFTKRKIYTPAPMCRMMDNGNTDALGIYAYECISSDKEEHLAVLGTILKEKGQTVPRFDTRNVLRNKVC